MAAATWITRVAKRTTFFRPKETKKLLHLGALPDALREFRVSSIELLLLLLRVSVFGCWLLVNCRCSCIQQFLSKHLNMNFKKSRDFLALWMRIIPRKWILLFLMMVKLSQCIESWILMETSWMNHTILRYHDQIIIRLSELWTVTVIY